MNGPQHYAEAERLLDHVLTMTGEDIPEIPIKLAEAQVHATLALTAATAHHMIFEAERDGAHLYITPQWDALIAHNA